MHFKSLKKDNILHDTMKLILKKFSLLAILSSTLLFFSCSTKKNTALTRAYHNLTAHYNAYFNGRDKFKSAVKNFEKNYKDDFNRILPVFKYPDETQGQALSSKMNEVIEKATKVIKFHSITVPPSRKNYKRSKKKKEFYNKKEFNKWVDDAYLLIGKAKFYKHDLMGALQTFEYIRTEYSYDPIKFDASLWKGKTQIQQGKYEEAHNTLSLLEGEKSLRKKKKFRADLYATIAQNYIKQNEYKQAIRYLLKALEIEKKKQKKIRYKFILAQLYEHLENYQSASNLYAYVAKSNTSYDMQFAAAIRQATSYVSHKGSFKSTIKLLNKMLKDEKNKEYKDQIYYAISNVYLKEKDTANALKALKLSSMYNFNNNFQKAQTLLLIASIYYDLKEYKNSKIYYDSTVSYLNIDYPNYDKILLRKENLTDLIKNLEIIQREDSLQRIAKMTENERTKFIKKIIKEVRKKKEEKRKAEAEEQQYHLYQQMQTGFTQNQSSNTGKWYFYNPATVSLGKAEFKRIWGNRPLEDNWRRKNKAIETQENLDNENGMFNPSDSLVNGIPLDETIEYYLKNLPLTDSALSASNKEIENALYEAGIIYLKRFNEYDLAIKYFEQLIKRFPKSKNKLNSYYNLYQLYGLKKNKEKSNYYKSLINKEFPNSEINKIISDPNYLASKEAKKDSIKDLYVMTYNFFTTNKLNTTLKAIKQYKKLNTTFLEPKFLLIEAFTYAKKSEFEKMKSTLEHLKQKYTGTTEDSLATYYINFIQNNDSLLQILRQQSLLAQNTNNKQSTPTGTEQDQQSNDINENNEIEETDEELPEKYKYEKQNKHTYVVIVDDDPEIVNRIKFNIINFNVDNFPMFDFNVKTFLFGTKKKLISVNGFKDAEQALKYFKALLYFKVFEGIDSTMYNHFIISTSNYPIFFKDKDIKGYNNFFIHRYLKNTKQKEEENGNQ